jgi:hypothetical protein
LDFTFAVYDERETICDVSGTKYFAVGKQQFRLWSNNPILVGMKQYIFETLWNSSAENECRVVKELSQVEYQPAHTLP